MGTLFKLVFRLLSNSAEKEADSSSSLPESGSQNAEAAENTSNLGIDRLRVVSGTRTPTSTALALVTVPIKA